MLIYVADDLAFYWMTDDFSVVKLISKGDVAYFHAVYSFPLDFFCEDKPSRKPKAQFLSSDDRDALNDLLEQIFIKCKQPAKHQRSFRWLLPPTLFSAFFQAILGGQRDGGCRPDKETGIRIVWNSQLGAERSEQIERKQFSFQSVQKL